ARLGMDHSRKLAPATTCHETGRRQFPFVPPRRCRSPATRGSHSSISPRAWFGSTRRAGIWNHWTASVPWGNSSSRRFTAPPPACCAGLRTWKTLTVPCAGCSPRSKAATRTAVWRWIGDSPDKPKRLPRWTKSRRTYFLVPRDLKAEILDHLVVGLGSLPLGG